MGGAARHLDPFLDAVLAVRPGWRIHVWVYDAVSTEGWPPSVQVHKVPWRSQAQRFRWENVALPQALTQHRADVLIGLTNSTPVRCPVPSVLYQRNALWFDRAWVGRLHGRARAEAAVRRWLTFVQARGASVVVTPSQAMAAFVQSWRGWPSAVRVEVIPHAVDTERFVAVPRGWPPGIDRPLRLLAVGHDAPHKDQLLLIELVAELQRRGRTVELTLTIDAAPATAYVEDLLARCESLGVAESVHFAGTATGVERFYADADIALSSSVSESFGFPLIEAMAVGVPIVASAIPATIEVAAGSAWLFPTGDVNGAADAVEAALRVPASDMQVRLARATAHAAAFTWEANASCVARVVDQLLGERSI